MSIFFRHVPSSHLMALFTRFFALVFRNSVRAGPVSVDISSCLLVRCTAVHSCLILQRVLIES